MTNIQIPYLQGYCIMNATHAIPLAPSVSRQGNRNQHISLDRGRALDPLCNPNRNLLKSPAIKSDLLSRQTDGPTGR